MVVKNKKAPTVNITQLIVQNAQPNAYQESNEIRQEQK